MNTSTVRFLVTFLWNTGEDCLAGTRINGIGSLESFRLRKSGKKRRFWLLALARIRYSSFLQDVRFGSQNVCLVL